MRPLASTTGRWAVLRNQRVCGLHDLKHMYDLSDDEVVERVG